MTFLNVDLRFKNCLTERLIQISIIFCNFVWKAAALLIVKDYFCFKCDSCVTRNYFVGAVTFWNMILTRGEITRLKHVIT